MAKKPVVPLNEIFDPKTSKNIFEEQVKFQNLVLDEIKKIASESKFNSIQIFTLGSLSYGGLCPYSDIDLLVVGDKKSADDLSVSLGQNLSNLKIKWWPKLDFDLATDIFDHISLFFLKPIFEKDKKVLSEFLSTQYLWIQKNFISYEAALSKDRQMRRSRYGLVGGELSPNIKYGPGGLRDSCQSLAWLHWSKDMSLDQITNVADSLIENLQFNLKEIYRLRFCLQILFQTDQLSLEFWSEVLNLTNQNVEDRKTYYQALYQQFFLTDLVFSIVNLQSKKIDFSNYDISDFKNLDFEIFEKLNFDNYKYFAYLFKTEQIKKKFDTKTTKSLFKWVHDLFLSINQDWQIDFLLDSGLLEKLLPEWHYIFGLTQSDHYHKYTVSEHLRQTLKSVCRLQSNLDSGYAFKNSMGELSINDWQILKWVAIFHDLKKGYEEDHSVLGKSAVLDFSYFTEEEKSVIASLVENHLKLSTFAFRYEHSDLNQLEYLNELFEDPHWLRLLLVFTGADIMGSNPQAWNKWKSDQLYFAYKSLMDFRNEKINVEAQDIEGFELSPQLVKVIGSELLKEDIILLINNKENNLPKEDWLVESIDENLWVRVFKKDTGPGTLSQILNVLYNVGLPVEQAFIASRSEKSSSELDRPYAVGKVPASPTEVERSSTVGASELDNAVHRTKSSSELDSALHAVGKVPASRRGSEAPRMAASELDSYVYNWFRLPLTYDKSKKQIQKRLELLNKQKEFKSKNLFAKIDRVIFLTENNGKLSFVFKGQDQNGVLLYISKIFENMGVNIQKAQINTWGQRIEDLFVVKKDQFQGDELLTKLEKYLKLPQSIKI